MRKSDDRHCLPRWRAACPHSFTRHGITIEDPYAWLRDPGYPEVKDSDSWTI